MADPWTLNIDMRQFQDDLRRLPAQLHAEIEKTNRKQAESFHRVVKRNAPRSDEGPHIADTLTIAPGDSTKAEYVVSIGNDTLPYGNALEYGHVAPDGSWVEGEHFWLPAKKLAVRRHRKALGRAIRRKIREMLKL